MTYRELHFPDNGVGHADAGADHESLIRSIFDNQSPVMKIWFVIMLVNLALILINL